jgi:cytochrome oxidase Cu insertion factor (SCO1/SenC/PrrC family)
VARRQAGEDRRRQRIAETQARLRRARLVRIGTVSALVVGVLAVVAVGWSLRDQSDSPPGPAGLPGPLGGPEIAQDVNTLVGKTAPAFTLSDSEGQSYTVAPGQGRPIVLVSHMGIT